MNDAREHSERFDAFGLVARHGHVAGSVDPFDLDRIHDSLGDEEGEIPPCKIAYRLEGAVEAIGRPVLNVALDGDLPLECQRCLRLFTWPVHQRTTLLLAHDEQELGYLDENDEREVLLAAGPLDVLDVVEEELLLALPYVPKCDRPDCMADAAAQLGDIAHPPSPFGVLGALKAGEKPDE
jgi:uncharacterized protein